MKRLVLLFAALLLAGCGEKNPVEGLSGGDTVETPPGEIDSSEAGAKALLSEFLAPGADHAKLSAALAPTPADYAGAFIGDAADYAAEGYAIIDSGGRMAIRPSAGQTELLLWKATTKELNAWTGDARDQFPKGFREIARHLHPGVTWYVFKFVEPGSTQGSAYDVLVCITGRWTFFDQPWQFLKYL